MLSMRCGVFPQSCCDFHQFFSPLHRSLTWVVCLGLQWLWTCSADSVTIMPPSQPLKINGHMFQEKPKIIVICGPTAIGKTTTAIRVAQAAGGEIISADSVQIYRYMDIGTAKPTADEMNTIPHYMVNIVNPDEPFDAALFARKASELISDMRNRGIVPVVAGGTGFYIKALLHGLFETDPVDKAIRHRLRNDMEKDGLGYLYQRLSEVDPETAKSVHPNDTYRILRALEIFEDKGIPISRARSDHGFSSQPYTALKIGLHMDRKLLYERINQRVDVMIRQGLVEEVQSLLEKGYTRDLKSMQTIGYRHVVAYLDGEIPWEESLRTLKRDTRRYAKRQLTWFTRDTDVQWTTPDDIDGICQMAGAFLAK